jgi:7-cyano-7-deazaguanine synthase
MSKNVLVLFSGGIDSTSTIHYYLNLGYNVKALFIKYGQAATQHEQVAIEKLSQFLEIETIQIETKLVPIIENGSIQGRNYLLLSLALSSFPYSKGIISLGIHSGTKYPDCTKDFIKLNQQIIDLYSNGKIVLDCPFISLHKKDIYNYFIKTNIPIELTYSCELGEDPHCGECLTCLDIKKLTNESKN